MSARSKGPAVLTHQFDARRLGPEATTPQAWRHGCGGSDNTLARIRVGVTLLGREPRRKYRILRADRTVSE